MDDGRRLLVAGPRDGNWDRLFRWVKLMSYETCLPPQTQLEPEPFSLMLPQTTNVPLEADAVSCAALTEIRDHRNITSRTDGVLGMPDADEHKKIPPPPGR